MFAWKQPGTSHSSTEAEAQQRDGQVQLIGQAAAAPVLTAVLAALREARTADQPMSRREA